MERFILTRKFCVNARGIPLNRPGPVQCGKEGGGRVPMSWLGEERKTTLSYGRGRQGGYLCPDLEDPSPLPPFPWKGPGTRDWVTLPLLPLWTDKQSENSTFPRTKYAGGNNFVILSS